MAYDPDSVKMGVCDVEFGGVNLGYTSGYVNISYSIEEVDQMVDQEDAPINKYLTRQNMEITVPLAEQNYERLAMFFPGATYSGSGTSKKMVLSGAAGTKLSSLAKTLVIKPINGTANDWITITSACPYPEVNFDMDKENNHVYTVRFEALVTTSGFVTFGDTSI